MREFNLFEFMVNKPELEDKFDEFFQIYNLNEMFTNEHRTSNIKVRLPDMQSVVNDGKYAHDLKELSNILSMVKNNKKEEEAIFKLIYNAKTFQKFMINVRKVVKYFETGVLPEHEFNFWNIVFYHKELI